MLLHGGWLVNKGTPSPIAMYAKDEIEVGGWLATHLTPPSIHPLPPGSASVKVNTEYCYC